MATESSVHHVWPLGGHSRIPAWVYSDEAVFAREMEVFHAGATWSFVGLECEIPEIGSFKRTWVGAKPVIVVRDAKGAVNVLENRCAHRGTAVCWENSGTAKSFTCPYHQWMYDLSGALRGVPFRRGAPGGGGMPEDFRPADHGLRRLRVHLEGGSIWATFSEDVPAFEDYCGPDIMKQVRRLLPGKPLRLLGTARQIIPCNWKLYFENGRDTYHATLLHSFFITFGLYRADSVNRSIPTNGPHMINTSAYAGKKVTQSTAEMKRFGETFDMLDKETVTPVDEFNDKLSSALQIFPSIFFQQHANSLAMRQIIPRSATSVEIVWTHYGYEDDDEQLRRLRLKQANMVGPSGFVSMDDSEVLTQVQRMISRYPESIGMLDMGGRDILPQDTMATDVGIRAFYHFYRNAMGF